MLKIAVCDDNSEFLNNAVTMLERWSEERSIHIEIFRFDNGDDLIKKNAVCHMDIILLDIVMPLLNGMDTGREIRQTDKAVNIIFLTSSPEFALESYEVKAKGYLLKPVEYEKLKEVIDDCCNTMKIEPKNLIVKTEFGYQKIFYKDIEYIEAQNKIIVIYMRDNRIVKTAETLHSFESKLDSSEGFFKCHRSYIVNIGNVDNFNMSEIVTHSGYSIPIARGYGKAFKEAYFAYMFEK